MGIPKAHREWVTNTKEHSIEEFSTKFMYSDSQKAYFDFTLAITNSKLKEQAKIAVLDNLKSWKENTSQVTLFWLKQKQALAIKKGKLIAGTSLVDAAADELPNTIQGNLQSSRDEHSGQTNPDFNNILQLPKRKLHCNDSDLDDNQSTTTSSQEPPQKKVAFLDINFPLENNSEYAPSSARSSLNSIDLRYINHLVGPGTTSSQLRTSARMIVGDVDVSLALMDARRKIVAHQSEIDNNSDLLCLNFIFDSEFMRKNLTSEVISKLPSIEIPDATDEEILLLSKCSIFAANHSFLETKRHFRDITGHSMVGEILKAYTTRPGLWQSDSHHSHENEDTYTESVVKNIIIGVFGDLDAADHWSRDPLPTPNGFEEKYLPDYFCEKDGLPFLIAEIKKPELDGDVLEGDQRKLPGMMKIMVDALLTAGVQEPAIIGLLVSDSKCEVYLMTVKYEAIYRCICIGAFGLPRNNLQLGLLLAALGPLAAALEIATKTLAAINTRYGNRDITKTWRRPSYYLKGIRIPIPVQPRLDVSENDKVTPSQDD